MSAVNSRVRAAKMNSGGNPAQAGFTLIELVMVVVVLGVLAATALPRFINLRSDANEATIGAMGGAVLSSANLVLAKSAILGVLGQAIANIDINGDGVNDVEVEYGYPSSHLSNGIPKVMAGNFASGWTWSSNAANTVFLADNLNAGKAIWSLNSRRDRPHGQLYMGFPHTPLSKAARLQFAVLLRLLTATNGRVWKVQ